MSRVNEFNELYERSALADRICLSLFVANLLASVFVFSGALFNSIAALLQALTAAAYVLISIANDCGWWFEAESANRKHLIEDAFGVDLTNRHSEGYFNNRFAQSFRRYVADTFESSFFSMKVSGAMLASSVFKTVLVLGLFCLLLYTRIESLSYADLTQAVFSAFFLEDTVYLWAFHCRVKGVYNQFYRELITLGVSAAEQEALLIAYAQEYECIKAHFKVRVSSKKFNEMNASLSSEWRAIEKKIRF